MKKVYALLLGFFLFIGYSQSQILLTMEHGESYNLPWKVNSKYDNPYGSFRINGGNFDSVWYTSVQFACVGKVNGLEDVKRGSYSFAKNVAIMEGYGYILCCDSERTKVFDLYDSGGYKYCKIYVINCTRNNAGNILSATIQYEYW